MLHLTLQSPACLALAHSVLQIEHWIALLGILGVIILGRSINHSVAPLVLLLAEVVDATNTSCRYTLLWTIVVALGALWNLDTTRLAVATKVSLGSRIDEVDAIYIHKVVVESYWQRIGNGHESTLTIRLHIVLLAADVYNHLTGLWSIDIEVSTVLLVNLRELIALDSGLSDECIGRNLNLLRHLDKRALRLETKMTSYSLTITATKLTITCCIEVQTVRTIGTAIR